MNKSFNLLYYVKRTKTSADGTAPIYLRITIDGERIEISAKRSVNPCKWNANAQKLNGNGGEVKSINNYLKSLEHRVYEVHREMVDKKLPLKAVNLKDALLGKDKPSEDKMLIPIFQEHNK